MELSKDEIAEELTSLQGIMRAQRRRRRELQKKHAVRGIDTPVDVLTEIEEVSEQLQEREKEITHLKSLAAADQVPVAEIEYQAMLAEEWDKSSGRLKLAQRARLDWTRVRLGIASERALVMEYTVRVQLAEELYDRLNLNMIQNKLFDPPGVCRQDDLEQFSQFLIDVRAALAQSSAAPR